MLALDQNVVERGVRGIFAREFVTRQRKAKYPDFCTIVDSDKEEEKYNSISTLPVLEEMADERVLAGFSEYSYTLKNKVYATGIKVPRRLFEFDQTGQIRTLVQSLGARVANFPDKLVWTVIAANNTCYDSSNFFSQSHDLGDGTSQSNDIAGPLDEGNITGDTKSKRDEAIAEAQLACNQGIAALAELTDDRGEPWHDSLDPDSLIVFCHPKAYFFLRTALEGAIVSDTSNLMVKQVSRVIPVNRPALFKDGGSTVREGTFYIAKVDTPIRPFIFQRFGPKTDFPDAIPEEDRSVLQALNSVEIQTIMRTGANIAAETFFNDDFMLGARTIYSAGYGMWQNCIRVRDTNYST